MISWRSFTTSKVLPTFVGQARTEIEGQGFTNPSYSVSFNSFTSVTKNSTIIKHGTNEPTTNTSPLAKREQQTTTTIETISTIAEVKFITAYEYGGEYEDDPVYTDPVVGLIWTTTTLINGQATFTEVSTNSTVWDSVTKTVNSTIKTTTTSNEVTLLTYTAIDGDVIPVAHTIYENQKANYLLLSVNSPNSFVPFSDCEYITQTRLTEYFAQNYVGTIEQRFFLSFEPANQVVFAVTSTKTINSSLQIATIKNWRQQIQESADSDAPNSINTRKSYTYSNSIVNSQIITTTTFQTSSKSATQSVFWTQVGRPPETQTTSTFFISNLLDIELHEMPGIIDTLYFPWKTTGNGFSKLVRTVKSDFDVVTSTTTNLQTAGTDSRNITFFPTDTFSYTGKSILTGAHYKVANNFISIKRISFSHIVAETQFGIADQNLNFQISNTKTNVAISIQNNAEFSFIAQSPPNFISNNIVGAIPLYPQFSGLISNNSDGWGIYKTSLHTTILGNKIGSKFSTTALWLVNNTIASSSKTFTAQSAQPIPFGYKIITNPSIAGGFFTPHGSRTELWPPEIAAILTTYNAFNSGTMSTQYDSYSTTSNQDSSAISIFSFLPIIKGFNIFSSTLLDNGLP